MKKIPLLARDGSVRAHALVDDEDYEHLMQWRWSLGGPGYPARIVTMQREMAERLGVGDAEVVHHDNENKLDFRRRNLKQMTRSEHTAHHQRKSGNRIRRSKNGERWHAWRNEHGRQVTIGTFDTPEEARNAVA